jgi:hypothetical protein
MLNPLDVKNANELRTFLEATKLIDDVLFEKNIDWIRSLKINPKNYFEMRFDHHSQSPRKGKQFRYKDGNCLPFHMDDLLQF